jgi:heptosyltransferase-2
MIQDSYHGAAGDRDVPGGGAPILIVPYMWIGDFVRCHSVVKVLKERWPDRPVDVLTSANASPLLDYMPGVRKGIVCDLPRGRLPLADYRALAARLRTENYGSALVMLRTWKAALAPFLAGIPERTGFIGEFRFLLLNDLRRGERRLHRMIDRCGALALPPGATLPREWPLPELVVPAAELAAWRAQHRVPSSRRKVIALCPGAIGRGKRWPTTHFAELARRLADGGNAIWVLGSPAEAPLAQEIIAAAAVAVDLTGPDLRNAVRALAAADLSVTNDSGLMHVSAALGTPTVALFGPTAPELWAPLNPLAAAIEPDSAGTARTPRDVTRRRIEDITPQRAFDAVHGALAQA